MELLATENFFENDYKRADVDPRITFPCYKSLDEFIEVDNLRSLDSYLTERINHHIQTQIEDYFLNLHRLDAKTPYQPGVREIWLSRNKKGLSSAYLDHIDEEEFWEISKAADDFGLLLDFIETLPFATKGRMIIFYDDAKKTIPAHRDHLDTEICQEFFWFRSNLKKPFYVLNNTNGEKKYVTSYSAWFDSVNQYHGCDGAEGLTFSIRIDGRFTDEFRKMIPKPEINPASTPALWACIND